MQFFLAVVFNYAKSKYTHIYIENLVKYVVSVNDYNISLFRIVSNVKLCNNNFVY
jgi:hypothetical protein